MANADIPRNALAKPSKGARIRTKGPTAKLRAAKARKDAKYAAVIRARVFERDRVCRAFDLGPCKGEWEWAHFGDMRRFKTRGLPPEERHTTAGSLVLCTRHHDDYDESRLVILALTGRGCDGDLQFMRLGHRAAHASGRRS